VTRLEYRDWPAAAPTAEPTVDGTPAVDRDGLHQFVAQCPACGTVVIHKMGAPQHSGHFLAEK
jgi:phage terminase large subunit GpA-like protein